jgi:hypothetical protein
MTKIIDPMDDIKIRNCIFGFKCDQQWDDMSLTNKDHVRFCGNCEKEVFFVEKKGQLLKAIQLNRCVAIKAPGSSERLEVFTSGVIQRYDEEN